MALGEVGVFPELHVQWCLHLLANVHERQIYVTLQFESVVLALLHIVGCVVKRVSLSTQVQPAGWTEVLVVDVGLGEVGYEGIDLLFPTLTF